MAILPSYDYKTLATRARAAASKLSKYRTSYSPKSVDIDKYKTFKSPISNSTSAVIPNYSGSVAREGQKLGGLGTVTVPFGGTTRYAGTSGHKAVDIANKKGTPIQSFTGGRVVSMDVNKRHGDKGYGNYVIIQDEKGGMHRYSHLDQVYKPIQVGSTVKKGQYLGGMGDTGQTYSLNPNKTGVHLHYDLKYNNNYVDPFAYLITNFYNQKQYG